MTSTTPVPIWPACTPVVHADRLNVRPDEIAKWDHLSRRLRVPFHPDGITSRFDGYLRLPEFDWDAYRARYEDLGRLDLILDDVLTLLYLPPEEYFTTVQGKDTVCLSQSGDVVPVTDKACPPEIRKALLAQAQ